MSEAIPIPPGFDVSEFPPTEAAVIGAVLIGPLPKATQLLAEFESTDLTEPRLIRVDHIARYLVKEKVAPAVATVASAGEHLGVVAQNDLVAFWVLLYDLVDVNIVPNMHIGTTMARQLVRASVRRTILESSHKLVTIAQTGDLPTLTAAAVTETKAIRESLSRLAPHHRGGDQEAAA